jgi:hypothetical protein
MTLKEEHRMRVRQSRVLRRILRPNTGEIIVGWRKLHEELRNLFSSPNTIRMINSRRMTWAGYVTCKVEKRKTYRTLVRMPEGIRSLGSSR